MSWPSRLYLVRHGESLGNIARDLAYASGAPLIDITERDMDVGLSPQGESQAAALGRWFGALPAAVRPDLILSSPYLRAQATAQRLQQNFPGASEALPILVDERLREKELGLLNRYTRRGVEEHFPEQARLRASIGKFYYRPPQGESWADVIFRLRSLLDTLCLQQAGKSLVITCHQVTVLCLRYLLERLDEKQLLAIDSAGEIGNCAVTEYEAADEGMTLVRYNDVSPLAQAGAAVTAEPPVAAA